MAGAEPSQTVDTRGKILAVLCSQNRTVTELADELGISANGVRGHLRQLEAERLVAYRVVRRGVGKPAHEYRLTAEGSVRLSRAYLPVLSTLLSVLLKRDGAREQQLLLQEVGRTLARHHPSPGGAVRQRADAAMELLGALGAACTVSEEQDGLYVQGACCPLRALVPDHPLACKAVEALLEEYIGAPVQERCDKHDPPACRLAIRAEDR